MKIDLETILRWAAIGIIIAFAILAVAACGDDQLPNCDDVGCDGQAFLVCTHDGDCSCPQVDADAIACYREPKTIGHH